MCAEGLQSLLQWICYNVLQGLWSSWVTDQGPVWNLVDGGEAFRLEPQWELRIGHRSSQQTSMRCWWFSSQKELEFWFFIRISRPYFQLDGGGELPQGGAQEDFTTSSTGRIQRRSVGLPHVVAQIVYFIIFHDCCMNQEATKWNGVIFCLLCVYCSCLSCRVCTGFILKIDQMLCSSIVWLPAWLDMLRAADVASVLFQEK